MYLEEVVLDGFKSYARRTVISGFDSQFNAITGLNGSGKSNVLDGICFVLGITNLSQVRVGSLQELVYKKGQAGVTKASVTLVFNNMDTANSPVGYEQYEKITITRQVVIGGRSKYLINGHAATVSRVQNLFHSVQLNVNNPHFLIMQGRITKVLNMKPPEILSMIEEAAGTRMFENKKQAALKTIEKKQSKVEEINRILAEDITPTLEKLRKERSQYLKWSSNGEEIERLYRFCVAYEYVEAQKMADQSVETMEQLKRDTENLQEKVKDYTNEVSRKEKEMKELENQKEKNMSAEFNEAVKNEEKSSVEVVKAKTTWENKKRALEDEKKTYQRHEAQLEENKKNAESLRQQLEEQERSAQSQLKEAEDAEKELKDLQTQYQAVTAGVGGSEDEDGNSTLQGQLMTAKKTASAAAAEASNAEQKVKQLEKQLKEAKYSEKQGEKDGKDLLESVRRAEKEVEDAEKELEQAKQTYDESSARDLKEHKEKLGRQIEKLSHDITSKDQALGGRFHFSYDDSNMPRGFSNSNVKGLVARLLRVEDSNAATALEVVAGGKLFQVVVDSEKTGEALLKHGNLKRRTTVIPLNKVVASSLSDQQIKKAKEIAGNKARPALSLINYDKNVAKAMSYTFGKHFVCDDLETAKKVAFDPNIKAPCVTLAGDTFDPAGTLEGGSGRDTNGTSTLLKLQRINELSSQKAKLSEELEGIEGKLQDLQQQKKAVDDAEDKLDLAKHNLALAQQRVETSSHGVAQQKVKDLHQQKEETESQLEDARKREKEANDKAAKLQKRVNESTENRDDVIKRLEKEIETAKKNASRSQEAAQKLKDKIDELRLELEQAEKDVKSAEDTLEQAKQSKEKLEQEEEKLRKDADTANEKYEDIKYDLDKQREAMSEADASLKQLVAEKDEIEGRKQEAENELKRAQHKANKHDSEVNAARKKVQQLEQKHEWIANDKKYFGKPASDYDFDAIDPKEASKKLKKLEREQEQLGKQVNKKVLGMIETAEQEYKDLMNKRKIIENDKAKIEKVIDELDEKKKEALKTTWEKVNRDFGSMYSTVLPGATARLDPPEGQTVLDGLEVKVAFGTVWKESLSELSGGQRSLLALSLILALLLFKPAPMYILDEIDAALDPSHTQNIGKMLRSHFKNSQFIIVSLKQGMFGNANVVFRTKFVNGVSTVTRTVTHGHSQDKGQLSLRNEADGEVDQEEEEQRSATGKGGKRARKAEKPSSASVEAL
eukprot:gb/GECG01008191.1/.p1 GENE.gb/GECG01008191.1/~~gb/GECG01008191.1/.p1  ORF type:complete len:1233 (+),score=321.40 gb/GECG01008191.1/:1-3699(+)